VVSIGTAGCMVVGNIVGFGMVLRDSNADRHGMVLLAEGSL